MEKKGNIGVEMVEKMRGSKPTKMKNIDYRELEPCIWESPARSKKHACLFGSPKLPSEMELSDMRRRQSSRTPTPQLSTENDGEVANESGRRKKVGLRRSWLRGEMGILRER